MHPALVACVAIWRQRAFSFDIFFDGVRESYMLVPSKLVKHVDLPLYIRTRTSAPHRFPQGKVQACCLVLLDLDDFLFMWLF